MKIKFDTVMKGLFPVIRRDWIKWESLNLQAHSRSAQCIKLPTCPETFHYFTDNYFYLIPKYLDDLQSVGTNWNFFVHTTLLSISLIMVSKNFSLKLKETGQSLLTCNLFLKISQNSYKINFISFNTFYRSLSYFHSIKHVRESIFLIVVMPTFTLYI